MPKMNCSKPQFSTDSGLFLVISDADLRVNRFRSHPTNEQTISSKFSVAKISIELSGMFWEIGVRKLKLPLQFQFRQYIYRILSDENDSSKNHESEVITTTNKMS